jgi:hypothetical protein
MHAPAMASDFFRLIDRYELKSQTKTGFAYAAAITQKLFLENRNTDVDLANRRR